jgi:hypothetical protein
MPEGGQEGTGTIWGSTRRRGATWTADWDVTDSQTGNRTTVAISSAFALRPTPRTRTAGSLLAVLRGVGE